MIPPNRIPLLLLIIGTLCVDEWVFLSPKDPTDRLFFMSFGVLLGQTTVLAVWLAAGRGSFAVRFGVALAANIGIAFLLSITVSDDVASTGSFVLCVGVTAFLFTAVGRGTFLFWAARTAPNGGPTSGRTFSLWNAISAMVFLSILLAVARYTDFPGDLPGEVLQSFAALSLISLTGAACIFATGRRAIRLAAYVVSCTALIAWFYTLGNGAPIVEMLLLLLSLAGYSAAAFAALKAYDRHALFNTGANLGESPIKLRMIPPNRILLLLLAVGTLCVDVWVFSLGEHTSDRVLGMAFFGVLFAQTGALSVWLAAGRGPFAMRFCVAAFGYLGLSLMMFLWISPAGAFAEAGGIVFGLGVITFVFTSLWRWASRVLTSRKRQSGRLAPSQTFSLWQALSAFVFLSAVLGVARYLEFPQDHLSELLQIFAACSFIIFTTVACVLSSGHPATRLLAYLTSCAAIFFFFRFAVPAPQIEWFFLGLAGYIGVACMALKFDGNAIYSAAEQTLDQPPMESCE